MAALEQVAAEVLPPEMSYSYSGLSYEEKNAPSPIPTFAMAVVFVFLLLAAVYESWDGSGLPGKLSGELIPLPTRVVQVATLAVNGDRLLGGDATTALLRGRSGGL